MRAPVIATLLLVAAAAAAGAQDPLSAAKDLYASAAYEDALSTLNRLDAASSPAVARQVDEYRTFCLYALGRTREAESIAESMIRKEPLARLEATDASPRIESMFSDVRRRLLPALIRERYRNARSFIDQKQFAAAEPHLTEAHRMIVEAQELRVKDDGLADLNVLVDGFLQLVRSAAEPRASAQAAQPAVAEPAATAQPAATVPAPAAVPRQPAPSSPAPARAAAPGGTAPARSAAAATGSETVYSVADEGISPPVTIDQRMPSIPTQLQMVARSLKTNGMIDIVIDETGRVVEATMRQSLNSTFDTLVVRTARSWKYRPAMKDGTPVKYLKTMIVVP
jgi:Gram-negative bacterial TonB protein C-terminal